MDEVELLTTERNVLAKSVGLMVAGIGDLAEEGILNEETPTETLKDLVTAVNVATQLCILMFRNEENKDQGLLEIVAMLDADVVALRDALVVE